MQISCRGQRSQAGRRSVHTPALAASDTDTKAVGTAKGEGARPAGTTVSTGLVLMVGAATANGTAWHVTSVAIFGTALVLLYTSSTLYHSVPGADRKRVLRKFDHAAIFLLIAGTYTPFLLVSLRGPWGWSLFGVIWGLAAAGIALKFWFAGRFRVTSTVIYLAMGWMVVLAVKPMLAAVGVGGLGLLLVGGLCYTLGAGFYLWKRLPYHHAIWHLFVLGGSGCHWAAVYFFVLPHSHG
jgi:hemolysin III